MTMQGTKRNADGMAGFVDDLNGAIRENPVAAGLIGLGVAWMFFGRAGISLLGRTLPGAARSVTGTVGAAAGATGSMVGDVVAGTASSVGDAARQIGAAISSGAESAAAAVRDTTSAGHDDLASTGRAATNALARAAGVAGRTSTEFGRGLSTSVQHNLAQTLERQPLLLGAIGLAIGAGIASAFPSTKMEQDLMGESGAAVKDRIQEIATEATEFASERAKQVLQELKNEASAQGLTPAAASESLKGVARKMKNVASTAPGAIKDRLS